MNNKFNMYSSEYIMSTHLQPLEFFIDKMLCKGLYILAGAPKVGKSWLALDMCLSVAEGTEFLKRKTVKGKVLYLSLEDSLIRIQNRLYEITDEPSDNLDFVITADTIGNGLEQQIENSKRSSPELKIVVIDTLQMVRSNTASYSAVRRIQQVGRTRTPFEQKTRLSILMQVKVRTSKCRPNGLQQRAKPVVKP